MNALNRRPLHVFVLSPIFFLACALLAACTTLQTKMSSVDLSIEATEVPLILEEPLPEVKKVKIKRIKTDSIEAGRSMVKNRRQFLADLFKQSQDPYFGTNRWSDDCLKRNQIGPQIDNATSVSFRAKLSANAELQPGACGPDSIDLIHIATFCFETKELVEINATGANRHRLTFVCPRKLTLQRENQI